MGSCLTTQFTFDEAQGTEAGLVSFSVITGSLSGVFLLSTIDVVQVFFDTLGRNAPLTIKSPFCASVGGVQ